MNYLDPFFSVSKLGMFFLVMVEELMYAIRYVRRWISLVLVTRTLPVIRMGKREFLYPMWFSPQPTSMIWETQRQTVVNRLYAAFSGNEKTLYDALNRVADIAGVSMDGLLLVTRVIDDDIRINVYKIYSGSDFFGSKQIYNPFWKEDGIYSFIEQQGFMGAVTVDNVGWYNTNKPLVSVELPVKG